jgi:hypothetical protein
LRAADPKILGNDLAFPPGLQKIPVAFQLARFDETRIDAGGGVGHGAPHGNKFLFFVSKPELALEPGAGVEHFGEKERGANRLKQSFFLQSSEQDVGAAENQIGLAHAGALLGHDTRYDLADPSGRIIDSDSRKILLEYFGVKFLLIGARRAVDHEPSFLFGRALSRFPVGFPIRRCLGGEKVAVDEHEERYKKS